MFPNHSAELAEQMAEQQRMMALYVAWAKRCKHARYINTVYTGVGLDDLVTERLRGRYDDVTFNAMKIDSGVVTTDRLINDITEKAATEVDEGVQFWLEARTEGKVEKLESEAFNRYLSVAGLDLLAQQIAPLKFLQGTIAVESEVVFNPRTALRKLVHHVLTPEHFDLEPNPADHSDFQAFSRYWMDADGVTQCKRTVTLDAWAEYRLVPSGTTNVTSPDRDLVWREEDRGTHKLGQIPVVIAYHTKPVRGLWGSGLGGTLADSTVEVNMSQTFLSYMQSMQIKVLGGEFDEKMPAGQNWRPGGGIAFGKGENFNILDMQTNHPEFLKTYCEKPRQRAAIRCGLSPNEFDLLLNEASGASLTMQYANRDKQAKRRRPSMIELLQQVYWLDLNVIAHALPLKETDGEYVGECVPIEGFEGTWPRGAFDKDGVWIPAPFDQARMAPASEVLPPYVPGVPWPQQPFRLVVDIGEAQYPQLTAERIESENDDLDKGMTTLPEIYRTRVNPDLTEEESRTRVEENQKTNQQLKRAGNPAPQTQPGGFLKAREMPTAQPAIPTTGAVK